MATRPKEKDHPPISLAEAAERLGVHYMTAYRYVRTGRLDAKRERGQWVIDPISLDALLDAEAAPRTPTRSTSQRKTKMGARRNALVTTMTRGDEAAAWRQIENLLAGGMEPERLYLEVLAPVMDQIGEAWASGELGVGDEHLASTVMGRVLGRLGPLFSVPGRKRGTVVLGAPSGDRHSLPVTLLADPLRGRRFDVIDLGADTPADSFAAAAIAADRLIGVGIGATTARQRTVHDTIQAIRTAAKGTTILLGGAAIADERMAHRLGADEYSSSAAIALETFEQLAIAPGAS